MTKTFTDREKLELVEFLITQWRPARSSTIEGERDTYLILKAIADDIRARKPGRAIEVVERIERAINNARASRDRSGYQPGNLREIAELAIGSWGTIRLALERLEGGGNG